MKKAAYVMASGDLLPVLVLTALNSAGVKQNLAAATGIAAYMTHLPSGAKTTLTAAISSAPDGEVTISWQAGDTDLPGLYRIWIVLTFPGGPMTFPSCPDGDDELLMEVCPV